MKIDVVQDIEFLLLLCEFLAVCNEVSDFPLNEHFEVGGVYSRSEVELGVEVLPLRAVTAEFPVALAHLFILVGEEADAEHLVESINHAHLVPLLDAPQVEVLSNGGLAVAKDVEEEFGVVDCSLDDGV